MIRGGCGEAGGVPDRYIDVAPRRAVGVSYRL